MPIILVVDDSRFDRRLIGGLLEKDIDWLVEYADNGVEALERMRIATPDVVVTDLLMPGMDGLQFVAAVRDEFSGVPVIVVTGQGSEALASRALRTGAASYVPKTHLADGLLETVEQVVSLSASNRNLGRLMQSATLLRHEFRLGNDPATIAIFIDFVQRTMDQLEFCPQARRMHVAVALEEAMLNAMYHGNLELPRGSLTEVRKDLHANLRSEIIDQRLAESPFAERSVYVRFEATPQNVTFVIRDEGKGFDISSMAPPDANESVPGHGGRGLVLIRNFMDCVEFNEQGSEIRMRLSKGAKPG
jgi:CheY-like chemotaxis protein/anti-sigma regulatory factor (Ser/Thr protein kinase)